MSIKTFIVRNGINIKYKDYGKMVNLSIDSENKKIEFEVLLKGEKESVSIIIDKYEIIKKNDDKFIKFNKISVSREWVDVLLENVVVPKLAPGKLIKINSLYACILDLLI